MLLTTKILGRRRDVFLAPSVGILEPNRIAHDISKRPDGMRRDLHGYAGGFSRLFHLQDASAESESK